MASCNCWNPSRNCAECKGPVYLKPRSMGITWDMAGGFLECCPGEYVEERPIRKPTSPRRRIRYHFMGRPNR